METNHDNSGLIFTGTSESLSKPSFDDAIKNAIDSDPKNVPGTDSYSYQLLETNFGFGGFTNSYTVTVKIKRVEPLK